jgi:predicted Zn finger-like uncharacterized protein
MLLTCPSCETRYQVDEAAIDRAAGRQVRCANCGYLWHFAPSLEEHAPPQSTPARPTAGSARPAAGSTTAAAQAMTADAGALENDPASPFSTPLDLGSAAAPAVGRMGPGLRGLLQVGAVLIVAAVIVVPILARNTVVESWPESAKVYNAVGLNTPAPGSGLDLKVTPLRSEGAFVVTGEITNATSRPLSVPPLRVTLRDTTQKEVEFQILDPPVETLAPGASARFKTVFEHPSIAATDVVATFGAE